MIYHFDPFSLDTDSLELRKRKDLIPLEPQVFNILAYLIENRDRVVSKDELIKNIWDGRAISDGALNSRINSVRRAVGDSGSSQAVIKTFTRRGFRFVGAVANDKAPEISGGSGDPLPDKPSIAVLPFDNLSGDPAHDFIGDGLTDDIITALSSVRSLLVIARSSTFHYKGTSPDIRSVADALAVRYVVQGSVRLSAQRLRVTVQLIDGRTGNHLWAERYDQEMADLFDIQDEMTRTIVARLEPHLMQAEYERVRSAPTGNLDAWALYHRGMALMVRRSRSDVGEARRLFEAAIEREPHLAGAYAGLAWAEAVNLTFGSGEYDAELALRYAKEAVQLDHQDAFAHFALGWVYWVNKQMDLAIAAAEAAIRINPSHAMAHFLLAGAYIHGGRPREGIPHMELAIRLAPADPSVGIFYARLAGAHLFLREYDKAVPAAQSAVQRTDNWLTRAVLTSALGHLGSEPDARQACEELVGIQPGITTAFVRSRYQLGHQPSMDLLIEGLRKAGLPEN